MTSLTAGDIVWVPYPHIDDNRRRPRPAAVVAAGLGEGGGLFWAMMISNAARAAWPGDVPIADHGAAGLPIPSKIRTEKITTLEARGATLIGRLSEEERQSVAAMLRGRTEALATS